MTFKLNRIIDTDSYKASHWLQYPPNTTRVFSYLESRGSERDYAETVFFGLQYLLKCYFLEKFTIEMVEEARELITAHGEPFNFDGWSSLVRKHHGKLPLRIRAVGEGSVVPTRNVLMTVENTDPEFFWLTSWFETQLMRIWYPCTVATQSYYIKKDVYDFLKRTSDDADAEIGFKVHDFGSRGVSSRETAAIGGAAHLVNFLGTDTMSALVLHRDYYDTKNAGYSIPAAEHSTITAWGRENEALAYRNMLQNFAKPGAVVAVVSDSWDIFHAVENIWGEQLRREVIDSGATVVIRPDSGDPVEVVAKVLHILAEKFGTSVNSKGYKVLKYVRVIQGDGVNETSIREILEKITNDGFSASNIAFGIGGSLLQKISRDTMKFAYKASAIEIDGEYRDVFKQPVTDSGKTSKKGRLDLINENGAYRTIKLESAGIIADPRSVLRTVFENGELLIDEDLETIRSRTAN
ncbi:MAG: nicotinate phosphoribosyltransferase [Pyrinomonadaceae bacterium]|nr:nicotinate phosphoribosyltransferase [Pyrinomonadaceae bacterium]